MTTTRSNRRRAAVLAVLLAAPTAITTAQAPRSPTLLVDLNQTPHDVPRSSSPTDLFGDAGTRWFMATDPGHGLELWETDGTPQGTRLVDDLDSGDLGSFRGAVRLPNGTLVVAAWTLATGVELFARAPGANRLRLVADLVPGADGSEPRALTVWGNACWFVLNGMELWRTDGTAAGTRRVEDLRAITSSWVPIERMVAGPGGLWAGGVASGRTLLHKAAPSTPSVEVTLPSTALQQPRFLGTLGTRLVFSSASAFGFEPFVHDGATGNAALLADIHPTGNSEPKLLAVEANRIWFAALDPVHGRELWLTDGTPAGTRRVVDVLPGTASGLVGRERSAVALAGGLVFAGSNPQVGTEPFFSDGTAAGTRPLFDIAPGTAGSAPLDFEQHAGRAYFSAIDPLHGRELWSTDGTSGGTRREVDIQAGTAQGTHTPLGSTTAGLLFAADDGMHGIEPWIFDPTTRTASLLANLAPDPINYGFGFGEVLVHDDFALFVAHRGVPGLQPFVTRGTLATTFPLTPAVTASQNLIWSLGALPAGAVFQAESTPLGNGLWITDGSLQGTRMLAPLGRGSMRRATDPLVHDGRLWFEWDDGSGPTLWRTDGTTSGTGPVSGWPSGQRFLPKAAIHGAMYGWGGNGTEGWEPWISDGTAAGTVRLADVAPGFAGSDPTHFTPLGRGVFFVASSPQTGAEPWFTDGTPAGTRLITELVPLAAHGRISEATSLADRVLFVANTSATGWRLWTSDGTATGTSPLPALPTTNPNAQPTGLARIGDRVVFATDPGGPASKLWATDGTGPGTVGLFDGSQLGAVIRSPATPAGDGGEFVFVARDGSHGEELWASDGTLAGTRVVTDSQAGPADGEPRQIFRLGDALLFQAEDGLTGKELHRLPLADFGAALARPIGRGCGAHIVADGVPRIGRGFALVLQATTGGAAGLVVGSAPAFGAPRPTCEINVANPTALGNFTTDPQGAARLPVQVPNDPALVGALLYLQSVHLRTGGPLFGNLELSEGLEVLVGD